MNFAWQLFVEIHVKKVLKWISRKGEIYLREELIVQRMNEIRNVVSLS